MRPIAAVGMQCLRFVRQASAGTGASGRYNYGLPGIGKSLPPKDKAGGLKLQQEVGECDVLFGIHPVMMALKSQRRTLSKLFVKDSLLSGQGSVQRHIQTILSLAKDLRILPTAVGKDVLDGLSCQRPHQGVCLAAGRLHFSRLPAEDIPADNQRCLWLMLDSVKDPMNYGAILRSAYFLDVDRVLVGQADRCPLSPVVSKASAGALEAMQLYSCDTLETIQRMIARGWSVVGTAAAASPIMAGKGSSGRAEAKAMDLASFVLRNNMLLVVGNEGEGLDAEVSRLCTHCISIAGSPHAQAEIDSLNVSVATAIILYQLLSSDKRRRQLANGDS